MASPINSICDTISVDFHAPSHTATIHHDEFTQSSFSAGMSVKNITILDPAPSVALGTEVGHTTVTFDLIGVDAPIANAIRRVLLAEVETMAIEKVYVKMNTSVMPDEVLAQRLGLVPILVDPSMFTRAKHNALLPLSPDAAAKPATAESVGRVASQADLAKLVDEPTAFGVADDEAIDFVLKVSVPLPPSGEVRPPGKRVPSVPVLSSDLVWRPMGAQATTFRSNPPAMVHPDILLTKLRPGQSIELVARAVKGCGREHAKWSPVATASYRLRPVVSLTAPTPISGAQADRIVASCPTGVFDIEESGALRVADEARCTACRECLRNPDDREVISVGRQRNYFHFSVESVGQMPATKLVRLALKTLKEKIVTVRKELAAAVERQSGREGKAIVAGAAADAGAGADADADTDKVRKREEEEEDDGKAEAMQTGDDDAAPSTKKAKGT